MVKPSDQPTENLFRLCPASFIRVRLVKKILYAAAFISVRLLAGLLTVIVLLNGLAFYSSHREVVFVGVQLQHYLVVVGAGELQPQPGREQQGNYQGSEQSQKFP